MGALQKMYRRHVTFNPANDKHRAAYYELRHKGLQHAELRFILEDGFANVISMMQAKIADHFSAPVEAETDVVKKVATKEK